MKTRKQVLSTSLRVYNEATKRMEDVDSESSIQVQAQPDYDSMSFGLYRDDEPAFRVLLTRADVDALIQMLAQTRAEINSREKHYEWCGEETL